MKHLWREDFYTFMLCNFTVFITLRRPDYSLSQLQYTFYCNNTSGSMQWHENTGIPEWGMLPRTFHGTHIFKMYYFWVNPYLCLSALLTRHMQTWNELGLKLNPWKGWLRSLWEDSSVSLSCVPVPDYYLLPGVIIFNIFLYKSKGNRAY